MTRHHWFLPETPDVLGMLGAQMRITIEGADAFARWAAGEGEAAAAVRGAELRGDVAKRNLLAAIREAFLTPIEPEDLFTLSRGVDRILNDVVDVVKESEAMTAPPDECIAAMAQVLCRSVRHLDLGLANLGARGDQATAAADDAIAARRELEAAYYEGMARLLDVDDRNERIARRELYRNCSRIGEAVVDVAERLVYAVVKES